MLSKKISGYTFKSPILTASGTYGYGDEVKDIVEVDKLGGIVTKSVTLHPREGNPPPSCSSLEAFVAKGFNNLLVTSPNHLLFFAHDL